MKEKYIDEKYGFWYEFGSSATGVDIASSDQRMDTGPVPKEVADILMTEHNRLQRCLVETAQAFDKADPEAFSKFWYVERTE